MKIRAYNKETDRDIIYPFYERKGDGTAIEWLPNGSSFVVLDSDRIVASGSLLLTNSPICFMEHLATNGEVSEITQGKALRFLAIELEKIAKNLGFTVILGLVPEDHFALANFYLRQKAKLGGKLMRVAFKFLGGE